MKKLVPKKEVSPRWDPYFIARDEYFILFWKEFLYKYKRNILFILGIGFDPRMCFGYESIVNLGGSGKRDCLLVQFDEGPNSPSRVYSNLVEKNLEKIKNIIPVNSKIITQKISMWSEDSSRRTGSRNSANIIVDLSDISKYTDIVVDISSMPRGIYFPLIGKILFLMDSNKKEEKITQNPNLHILVSENAQLDSKIKDEGIDEDANYMYGFTGTLETESYADLPKVWIPILGENQAQQLIRMVNKIDPNEICPMLPMPSVDPRRGDNLLTEYREILFDRLRVDPKNYIYVAEQNPFEVYREIFRTVQHYKKSLETLGGCQIAISASSSKLLSIGALLAAYELKNQGVGIINIETYGYQIDDDIESLLDKTELFTIWISGECYE